MIPRVTLYCGECAAVMAEYIPDNSVDLTVTSPPYDNLRAYKGYTFDFEAIAQQLWRVTKPGGVIVWVVADETINGSETGTSFRQALRFMEIGFRLHDTMIYKTKRPPLTHPRYEQEFEYMFVLAKGAPSTFNPLTIRAVQAGRTRAETRKAASSKDSGLMRGHGEICTTPAKRIKGNVWEFTAGNNGITDLDAFQHPAIFPENLARDHILSWSNPGDLVLDPMQGSGTTGKMAVLLQRHYIGIDISSEYTEMARHRIAVAQMQPCLPELATPDNQRMEPTGLIGRNLELWSSAEETAGDGSSLEPSGGSSACR